MLGQSLQAFNKDYKIIGLCTWEEHVYNTCMYDMGLTKNILWI